MESMIKVKALFATDYDNERIEAQGKQYALDYGAPLVRYSVRQMNGYKEALFCYSTKEPEL
jgi:hypothetical protein